MPSVEFKDLKVGDKLRIVNEGAPGFARLGDIVTAIKVSNRRVDVRHDVTGDECFFALTCGAARLELVKESK